MKYTVAERLERNSIPVPHCGCKIWLNYVMKDGYGVIRIGDKTMLTHRVSWMERYGPIPEDTLVCHTCDIPSCINPDHLFLGTDKDNSDDKIKKGRAIFPPKGRKHWANVIDENQVIAIRAASGTHKEIAAMFGNISHQQVGHIKRRERWKNVPESL